MVNDGAKAVSMINKNDYDIVLMDLQMPVMNGFEATEHIRNTMNSKILYPEMTEMEFAKWSYEEGRCNIDFSDPNNWDNSYYNFDFEIFYHF